MINPDDLITGSKLLDWAWAGVLALGGYRWVGRDMKLIAILALSTLSGCTTLASKEAAYGCQMADVASTAIALAKVGTVEANPLVASILHSVGWPGLIAFKLGVAWLISKPEVPDDTRAIVSGVTCAVALHNLML